MDQFFLRAAQVLLKLLIMNRAAHPLNPNKSGKTPGRTLGMIGVGSVAPATIPRPGRFRIRTFVTVENVIDSDR
jgi:hypothetical protein